MGSLDTRTRLLIQLASLVAGQAFSEYRVMLGAALTGCQPRIIQGQRSSTVDIATHARCH
jgi:alkylhydroperoxidase/carboxymuconolactone decarboxylase family protein YurZ